MTTIGAYELTLDRVRELKEYGIKVKIRPCDSRDDKELIKEYSQPESIPPEKWVNVSFEISNIGEAMRIHEAANYLGMCGITFDSGGCSDHRDWELDWSFSYTGKEDEGWREARDEVEDLINQNYGKEG